MKILVIYTGGTIGSSIKNGWISTDKSTKYHLIQNYEIENGSNIQFVCEEPYFIASENLSSKEINTLTDYVLANLDKDYDGIIVTHGTDTLQFSSVALSYAVGNSPIPILIVSSNYPLDDERSNGSINFKAAVEFIKQGCGKGVFISYKNRGQSLKFHKPLYTLCYGESDDLVHSLYDMYFAEYTESGITIINNIDNPMPMGSLNLCDKSRILTLTACPAESFDYDVEKYNCVIFRPYHSGTLNTDNPALKRFCQKANKANLPLFVTNIHSGATYESSKLYEELGIIPVPCSTFVRVYMRLWIAISRNEDLKNLF